MVFSVFGYTKRQLLIYVMLALSNFASALCISIQAPFFPSEAEKKGATATEYGFIFGIFELVCFIVSPIFGKFIDKLGPNFMCTAGLFFNGSTCILFGQLDKVNGTSTFVGLAFAIRITEALGNAAFKTSSFSIIAKEYPDKTGSVFSTVQSFFGVGFIAGPTFGGYLYSIGGYSYPFTTLGTFLLATTVLSFIFLPKDERGDGTFTHGMTRKALRIKAIPVMVFAVAATTYTFGCIQVGLEPHLRRFGLSPIALGSMFVISGVTYAITSPLWGILSDKYLTPRIIIIIGGIAMVVCFTFIGPAPYFDMEAPLWLIFIALLFQGVAVGAQFVGSYAGCHKEAISHGMPDDLKTYGVLSGLWMSAFAFGAFIGPTLTGYLMDVIGFRASTQVVVILHILVVVFIIAYECYDRMVKDKGSKEILVSEKKMLYGTADDCCDKTDATACEIITS